MLGAKRNWEGEQGVDRAAVAVWCRRSNERTKEDSSGSAPHLRCRLPRLHPNLGCEAIDAVQVHEAVLRSDRKNLRVAMIRTAVNAGTKKAEDALIIPPCSQRPLALAFDSRARPRQGLWNTAAPPRADASAAGDRRMARRRPGRHAVAQGGGRAG